MSSEMDLNRYRREAHGLRSDISKASSTVADKRRRAADARSAATRTKSPSVASTRLREADSAERAANDAEKKRAGLEKKLADVEKKITDAQARYEREQRDTQRKALDGLRRQNDQAMRQFAGQGRAGETMANGYRRSPPPDTEGGPSAQPDHDVFLSHASEDKDDIARPLQAALQARGLTVWFDEINIKVGQSIRQEIEKGIAHATFGVVILSPNFFAKQWTQAELDALFTKKLSTGRDLLLPIWHRVTRDQVESHSPLVAGILALNTSLMSTEQIADAIAEAVRA